MRRRWIQQLTRVHKLVNPATSGTRCATSCWIQQLTAFTRLNIFADKNISGARGGVLPWKLFTGSVYPSNMAPISLKLWENAFQTICNFRFFNSKKKSTPKKIADAHFFSITAFFWRFGLAKVGIGTSVVQNHCLGCDFQVCTMLHRRETSTFVFSTST